MDIGITVKSHNSTKTHTQKYTMIDVRICIGWGHLSTTMKAHQSQIAWNAVWDSAMRCMIKKKHINNISTKEATPTTNKY